MYLAQAQPPAKMANNTLILGALVTPLIGAIVALIFANSDRLQRSIGVLTGLIAWVFSVSLLVQVHDVGVQTDRKSVV